MSNEKIERTRAEQKEYDSYLKNLIIAKQKVESVSLNFGHPEVEDFLREFEELIDNWSDMCNDCDEVRHDV